MKPKMITRSVTALALVAGILVVAAPRAQEVLPKPQQPFSGKIGRTAKESKPDFPKPLEAPKGAPNVLLILTDDVGWGASSTFGGPIPTPTYDKLAKAGLRFNNFHTTALCSPTRAALITGRNHHTCATGVITEFGTGFPGYNSLMPKSCGTVAEMLKQNGWNTSWYGKNHNVPDWQTSQAGPFDLGPTGLGFEYFYGFLGGDTDQWHPAIFDGTKPIEAPHDPNYHLDADLADRAVAWIRQQHSLAPGRPFFAYYSPGLCHAPHHAPKEWIAKFKGQFDTFTYYPGTFRVPEGAAPDTKNRSFTITAEVEIPSAGAEGVIITQGGRFGGWGLLVVDGKPEFTYAFSNQKQHKYRVVAKDKLAAGKHTIKFDFQYDGPGYGKGGTGTLSVDGKQAAQGKIERTIPVRFSLDETLDVAMDTGTPVIEEYVNKMPYKFTGDLKKVVVELGRSGLSASDENALKKEMERALAARE